MSLGLSRGSIGKILNKSPLAQARGGCHGGCRGTSCSVIWSGLIGAANVSLPRYYVTAVGCRRSVVRLQKPFCELTTDNYRLLQVSRKGYVGGAGQAQPDDGTGDAPASAAAPAPRLRERTLFRIFSTGPPDKPDDETRETSLKGGDPAAGSPTATLLRLHPSR